MTSEGYIQHTNQDLLGFPSLSAGFWLLPSFAMLDIPASKLNADLVVLSWSFSASGETPIFLKFQLLFVYLFS